MDNKKEILSQNIDDDEMKQVSGSGLTGSWGDNWGEGGYFRDDCPSIHQVETDISNCTQEWRRNIYAGGFANCAATVEDGSWCGSNDACYDNAVDYQGMNDCSKAWH